MASGDIAVPDLSYFIEHDLRNAIQEMDENAEREAHQATTDANISSGSNILRTSTSAALNATKKKQKKNKKAPDTTHAPKKFLSPVGFIIQEELLIWADKCRSSPLVRAVCRFR